MRLATLLLCALLSAGVCAASERPKSAAEPFRPQHEVRLGVGAFPLLNGDHYSLPGTCGCEPYNPDTRYTYGKLRTTGALGVGYGYRLRRWFEVGATLTYTAFWRNTYTRLQRAYAGGLRDHHFTLTLYVRFGWLNRPSVRLYSQAGLGVGYGMGKDNGYATPTHRWRELYPTLHLTLLGISVGRRFFVFAELTAGNTGLVSCGVGYRFDTKK